MNASAEIVEFRCGLPPSVKGIQYMKNHHWVEVTTKDGKKHFLPASMVVLYECCRCSSKLLMFSNVGEICCPNTLCGGFCSATWGEPMLSFLPEEAGEK